jgi:hypothetical protein
VNCDHGLHEMLQIIAATKHYATAMTAGSARTRRTALAIILGHMWSVSHEFTQRNRVANAFRRIAINSAAELTEPIDSGRAPGGTAQAQDRASACNSAGVLTLVTGRESDNTIC